MDVETAFLNSDVEEEIYVKCPEGFEKFCEDGTEMVLKLKKSLYGLKQAPANWHKTFNDYLVTHCKVKATKMDNCCYVGVDSRGKKVYILLYVDDIIMFGDSILVERLKILITSRFVCKDLSSNNNSSVRYNQALGMVINHDLVRGVMTLSQELFLNNMLERFLLNKDAKYRIPAEPDMYKKVEEFITSKRIPIKSNYPYREAVGSLLWLSSMTRPDISNTVRYLSRFVSNFHQLHVDILQRLLGYLNNTRKLGVVYRKDVEVKKNNVLIAYSDSSYADDLFTGKSTWGSVIMCNGGPVWWRSVQSDWPVLSSTHAEYGAINMTVLAVWYVANLLAEINGLEEVDMVDIYNNSPDKGSNALKEFKQISKGSLPVDVMVDNQAAIHIGTFDSNGKRAKHINVRYEHVKAMINAGICKLEYVSTTEQLADILTKCLNRGPFEFLRDKILGKVKSYLS